MSQLSYGIDVGGTKMEMAVFDEQWQLLDRWREPTPVDDFDAFASVLNRMVSEAINALRSGEVWVWEFPVLSGRMVLSFRPIFRV